MDTGRRPSAPEIWGNIQGAARLFPVTGTTSLYSLGKHHQPALNYVKKTVFDVDDGGPILGPEHPAMIALRVQPKGDYTIVVTAALFLMPGACRRRQRASVDRGKHISRRR